MGRTGAAIPFAPVDRICGPGCAVHLSSSRARPKTTYRGLTAYPALTAFAPLASAGAQIHEMPGRWCRPSAKRRAYARDRAARRRRAAPASRPPPRHNLPSQPHVRAARPRAIDAWFAATRHRDPAHAVRRGVGAPAGGSCSWRRFTHLRYHLSVSSPQLTLRPAQILITLSPLTWPFFSTSSAIAATKSQFRCRT